MKSAESAVQGRIMWYSHWQLGDTNGQNLDQFGAEWYVLSPMGKTIKHTQG